MPQTFETQHRVAFSDNDLAGFVHFTNYLRYMEETEHEFLRSHGLDVIFYDDKGSLGFPRVEAKSRFFSPARYGHILDIKLTVVKNDGKRIDYAFEIRREKIPVAEGQLSVVCCRFPMDRDPYAIPIPDNVLDKIPLSE